MEGAEKMEAPAHVKISIHKIGTISPDFYDSFISDKNNSSKPNPIYARHNENFLVDYTLLSTLKLTNTKTLWPEWSVNQITNCTESSYTAAYSLPKNLGVFPTFQITAAERFGTLSTYIGDPASIMIFVTASDKTNEQVISSRTKEAWNELREVLKDDDDDNSKGIDLIGTYCEHLERRIKFDAHETLITPYFNGFVIVYNDPMCAAKFSEDGRVAPSGMKQRYEALKATAAETVKISLDPTQSSKNGEFLRQKLYTMIHKPQIEKNVARIKAIDYIYLYVEEQARAEVERRAVTMAPPARAAEGEVKRAVGEEEAEAEAVAPPEKKPKVAGGFKNKKTKNKKTKNKKTKNKKNKKTKKRKSKKNKKKKAKRT